MDVKIRGWDDDVPFAKTADLHDSSDVWGTVKMSLYLGTLGVVDMVLICAKRMVLRRDDMGVGL